MRSFVIEWAGHNKEWLIGASVGSIMKEFQTLSHLLQCTPRLPLLSTTANVVIRVHGMNWVHCWSTVNSGSEMTSCACAEPLSWYPVQPACNFCTSPGVPLISFRRLQLNIISSIFSYHVRHAGSFLWFWELKRRRTLEGHLCMLIPSIFWIYLLTFQWPMTNWPGIIPQVSLKTLSLHLGCRVKIIGEGFLCQISTMMHKWPSNVLQTSWHILYILVHHRHHHHHHHHHVACPAGASLFPRFHATVHGHKLCAGPTSAPGSVV